MQFSSTFTDMFQPTRLNHQVAQCLTNYKGVQLSPAQKEIILNELKIEGTSQVSIAKYLHVEPHRIWKMCKARQSGIAFSLHAGCPRKIDDIANASLQSDILQAKLNKKPLRKSEAMQLTLKYVKEVQISIKYVKKILYAHNKSMG